MKLGLEGGWRSGGAWRALAAAACAAAWTAGVAAREPVSEPTWPQWRGPARDGQVRGPAWPDKLSDEHCKQLWKVSLGPSYSGPIVSADRVFVTESVDRKNEVVRALARDDGRDLWRAEWPGVMTVPFFAWANGSWIRATPALDGDSLYVAGMRDVLVCLSASDGAERWRVDFMEKFKTPLPAFGFVCSPLVRGDHVYVQAGASFAKLDKKTGEAAWRVLVDTGGMNGSAFSSPTWAELPGGPRLLVQTRDKLACVEPETGAVEWEHVVPAFRGMNIVTPTCVGNTIFTSSYGGKSWLFRAPASGDPPKLTQVWENRVQGYMSSPVVIDDHVYLHLRNQRFTCIALATGKECWITEPFGKYWSLVANGDKILALDANGTLRLIRANTEKFDLLDERKVSDDESWAHLAVCGPNLYVRGLGHLTAFKWE